MAGRGLAREVAQAAPAWRRRTGPDTRIPVTVAVVVAVVLQLLLPDTLGLRPRLLLPVLEIVLLILLTALNPVRMVRRTAVGRWAGYVLVGAVTLDNTLSAIILDHNIITGHGSSDPGALLSSGAEIYLTNIIAFAIWYWELDRGGPFERAEGSQHHADFLFPQMSSPDLAPPDWEPRFFDYLYLSFTNVTAFSPTDTMPLSRWCKFLMLVQSMVALSTTGLVIARAVNVLK